MNETPASTDRQPSSGAEEHQSALFAHLLMQQTNMALMLLGKVPHPGTGQTTKDIDSARVFIDMVEMLEAKTRGNLTSEESRLLKQTLTSLRLSFVEAVESPAPAHSPTEPSPAQAGSPARPKSSEPVSEEEQRKKFTKKY